MKPPAFLGKAVERIEALTRRDRMVLMAGVLAAAFAVELQVVLAMRDRRVSSEAAQTQDPAKSQAQIEAAARLERETRLKDVQAKLAGRRKLLAQQGLASPPQAIFDTLRKTLALQGVQVLELRALPEKAETAQPPADAGSATGAALAAAASDDGSQPAPEAASAPAAEQVIFRHRTQVRIAGPLAEVSRIVQSFEKPALPLRLETVRFTPASDPSMVEASFVLLTISQDRTWLAL